MRLTLIMNSPSKVVTFRGRFLGVTVLVIIQAINGFIHIFSGFALILGDNIPVASSSTESLIFSYYTLVYGFLTFIFASFFLNCEDVSCLWYHSFKSNLSFYPLSKHFAVLRLSMHHINGWGSFQVLYCLFKIVTSTVR